MGHPGIQPYFVFVNQAPRYEFHNRISNRTKKRPSPARFGRYLDFIEAQRRLPTGIFAGQGRIITLVDRKFARNFILIAGLSFSTQGMAQTPVAKFHIHFSGSVDCEQPVAAKNIPISGDGRGVLNADGSASADITETAFIFSSTIHFDGRIGAAPTAAPGGSAQVRVAGRNSLKLIWNLPNNALVVNIVTRGQSCSASFAANLFPGKRQYTLFDGSTIHYCGRPRVAQASCEVR
jgi:hypothetical protein